MPTPAEPAVRPPEGAGLSDRARPRDAARTRDALLGAANELFGLHGYARTTLRQIGEHAGVDPALVARYFGSKAGLYVASIEADDVVADRPAGERAVDPAFVRWLLERATRLGPSPVLAQVVTPTDDDDIRDAARRILTERRVEPLAQRLRSAGMADAELRAQVALAALAGIALARSADTFVELAEADLDHLVALTIEVLAPVLEP